MKGDFDSVLQKTRGYDVLEGFPWFMIYKELDQRIPGSRFILTTREKKSWYKSVADHIGDIRSPPHEWIYGRGKGIPLEDKAHTLAVCDDHNKSVIKYFEDRPNDLLILDLYADDKWQQVCKFLDHEVPEENYPHSNKASDKNPLGLKSKLRTVRRKFKNYLVLKFMDTMGYW
ncbi:MAG: sulfotransferase [Gammaproteobacteria bacterium]|nr:hypothetical protein [Chromatiales bacterium]MDP6674038.1 sulfotransferase [Gammaproteobacteria bacterium]